MNPRWAEIEKRKQEIRELLSGEQEVDLEKTELELRELDKEKVDIEKREKLASSIQKQETQLDVSKIEKPKEVRSVQIVEKTKEEILASPEYRQSYYNRLLGKDLTDVEQRILTTAGASVGSAVPTTTLNMIIDRLRQTSVLFPKISVSNIPNNVTMVVANAKNASAWKAEGTNGTFLDDTVTSVTLNGYENIKLVEISATAYTSSIDALESYISAEIGRQMGISIENAILNGTGSANNQPVGILSGITWTSGTNYLNWGAGAPTYDNLIDGVSYLPTLYHQNAVMVMSRATLFGGIRKIKQTTGEPIFIYNAQDKFAGSVFGYPVIINDYIANDVILFGDLSYYYFNFVRQPQIDFSRDFGFQSGRLSYRGMFIADGKPALTEAFVKIGKTGV
jgi:HK97 family phage major capsid protein